MIWLFNSFMLDYVTFIEFILNVFAFINIFFVEQ